jgi:hypothetical protein
MYANYLFKILLNTIVQRCPSYLHRIEQHVLNSSEEKIKAETCHCSEHLVLLTSLSHTTLLILQKSAKFLAYSPPHLQYTTIMYVYFFRGLILKG